jgi:hypothetical protein
VIAKPQTLINSYYADDWKNSGIGLWRRWKSTGDVRYRNMLVKKHTPLLESIVCSHNKGRMNPDMFQEAVIGFLMGLDRYNEFAKCKITSYCVFWVNKQVRKYIDECSRLVRVPWRPIRKSMEIEKRQKDFFEEYGGIGGVVDDLYANEPHSIRAGVNVILMNGRSDFLEEQTKSGITQSRWTKVPTNQRCNPQTGRYLWDEYENWDNDNW